MKVKLLNLKITNKKLIFKWFQAENNEIQLETTSLKM
jgi:hypothetical protein